MRRKEEPLSETEQRNLLRKIDIVTAINYFGVTELLDSIGVAEMERYLEQCRADGISPVGNVPQRPAMRPVSGGKQKSAGKAG